MVLKKGHFVQFFIFYFTLKARPDNEFFFSASNFSKAVLWALFHFSLPHCFIVPLRLLLCSRSSGSDWISAMWHQQPAQVHRPAHQSDAPQNQQNQQGEHKKHKHCIIICSQSVLHITLQPFWRWGVGWKNFYESSSLFPPGIRKPYRTWKYLLQYWCLHRWICVHTMNIFFFYQTISAAFQRKTKKRKVCW